MESVKEFLLPFKQTPNVFSKDEAVIETNVYTQTKGRFLLGCFWEIFLFCVLISSFVVSIGCLATANQEADNGEWLQITTGVLILILVIPLLGFLLVFLPHFFFSAVSLDNDGLMLPRSFLLLRTYVRYSDIKELTVDTSGAVIVHADKKYLLSAHIDGLSQLLWYLVSNHSHIRSDEFVQRRISNWEAIRESAPAENNSLL